MHCCIAEIDIRKKIVVQTYFIASRLKHWYNFRGGGRSSVGAIEGNNKSDRTENQKPQNVPFRFCFDTAPVSYFLYA